MLHPSAPHIDPKYARFRLKADRSKIEGWGVYADEDIPAWRRVIEYTGERINRREKKRRAESKYLFTLDSYWTIDGAVGGSGAEFINHSCEPNLESRIVSGRIYYVSLRRIEKGQELTVDYNFDEKDEEVACRCGSPDCRGTINHK